MKPKFAHTSHIVFAAHDNDARLTGMVVGHVSKQTQADLTECNAYTAGYVDELFVEDDVRGQ